MDIQSLKEYTLLNLQRSGLKLTEEDRKKNESLKGHISKIARADHALAPFDFEVRDARIERFCYSNMSLAYWCLVVCMSLLGLFLDEYLKTGAIPVPVDFLWAVYILPAVFLVGRLFVFSFVNFAHLALLALCVVMTILKIRIFGSEMNWMWVFIVVGTILTLLGRLWEGSHRMKENKKWYQDNVQTLKDGEKAIEEAVPVFNSIGAQAEAELKRNFPGTKREARSPWFAFKRKLEYKKNGRGTDKCEVIVPKIPEGKTDFINFKENTYEKKENEAVTVWTETTISGQRMGYEEIDRTDMMELLKSGKVKPFFGMAVPEHCPDLIYRRYYHRWDSHTREITQEHYESVRYEKSKARREAEIDLTFMELDHLGNTAEWTDPDSMAAYQRKKEYLEKKKEYLDSFADDEIHTWHGERTDHDHFVSSYEIADVEVYTPDRKLVGLYCGETANAIEFACKVARKHWGAEVSAGSAASSEAQKGYLYRNYLS